MSRASVRHDAVWKLGNLRLSCHQHVGGCILISVGTVNEYVLIVFSMSSVSQWRVQMRRASVPNVLPRLQRDDGNPPKLCKRHIVVSCFVS